MRIPSSRFFLPTITLFIAALLALSTAAGVAAPEGPATAVRDPAKATRMIASLQLRDEAQAGRVAGIVGAWLTTLHDWHVINDPRLRDLWAQWNAARAVVPKDEFPAEVIAQSIDEVYASLRPAYRAFLTSLATELTPEQIDALKEAWSRSPGMRRTYDAYLEIVPDLTGENKKVILDRLLRAREDAMLTESDKEIVMIFKRHKVKVEAYIGSLEWAKLHRAYANRGK